MRVSNSKIKTWRRCPNKYRYKYVMGLRPKAKDGRMEMGSWIHDLLMHHYDGRNWKAHHKKLTKKYYSLFEEEREMLEEKLSGPMPEEAYRIMKAYLRNYKNDDEQWRVVDTEMDEIVTLPNGLELNIIIDLIVEDRRGRLWAWDHKSRGKFADSDSMLLDPQLTHYYDALEIMGYTPLGGVCYNEIRTKAPTIPRELKAGGLSKAKKIDTDVRTYMAEIKRLGLDPSDYKEILHHLAINQKDKFFRRTFLPKDPPMIFQMRHELMWSAREMRQAEKRDEFPRTFIPQSCKWDCEFKDICIAELHGGDISTMVKMNFTESTRRKRGEEDPDGQA